ncbi:MAG: hypothetical protein IKT43_00645, partial [Clostridia bacterium]|nr:hypothetical protein [Clostridia bacterium]
MIKLLLHLVRELVILKPSRAREGEGARVRLRKNARILSLTVTCCQTNAKAFVGLKMTQNLAKPIYKSFCGAFFKKRPLSLRVLV